MKNLNHREGCFPRTARDANWPVSYRNRTSDKLADAAVICLAIGVIAYFLVENLF